MKKYDEVVNRRADWFMRLEKAFHDLDAGQAEGICRIPRKIYEAANPKEQIRLLKMMLDELMAKANVQKGRNLHCPFHDDRSPSMIWKNGSLHCFACHDPGETRDIFDLIGLLFGLKSFAEKKDQSCRAFRGGWDKHCSSHALKYKNAFSAPGDAPPGFSKPLVCRVQGMEVCFGAGG